MRKHLPVQNSLWEELLLSLFLGEEAHSERENNRIVIQTRGYSYPTSHSDNTGELDRVMHGHRAPCHGPTHTLRVLVRWPHATTVRCPHGNPKLQLKWGRGVPIICCVGTLPGGRLLTPPWTEDGGVAIYQAVYSERDIPWRTVM